MFQIQFAVDFIWSIVRCQSTFCLKRLTSLELLQLFHLRISDANSIAFVSKIGLPC